MKTIDCGTRYIFVCTTVRPIGTKPSCGARGQDLLLRLQEAVDNCKEWQTTAVVPAGCLGACEQGPLALDPSRGRLYGCVEAADVGALVDAIVSDEDGKQPWILSI